MDSSRRRSVRLVLTLREWVLLTRILLEPLAMAARPEAAWDGSDWVNLGWNFLCVCPIVTVMAVLALRGGGPPDEPDGPWVETYGE